MFCYILIWSESEDDSDTARRYKEEKWKYIDEKLQINSYDVVQSVELWSQYKIHQQT